jgi:uncharacterized protein (UPF0335 family)
MTNSDLRQRAEHIGRLMDQRDDITEDIKGAFEAAKSVGFNAAALKAAIKIARLDVTKRAKHDSAQSDLLIYLAELEGRDLEAAA